MNFNSTADDGLHATKFHALCKQPSNRIHGISVRKGDVVFIFMLWRKPTACQSNTPQFKITVSPRASSHGVRPEKSATGNEVDLLWKKLIRRIKNNEELNFVEVGSFKRTTGQEIQSMGVTEIFEHCGDIPDFLSYVRNATFIARCSRLVTHNEKCPFLLASLFQNVIVYAVSFYIHTSNVPLAIEIKAFSSWMWTTCVWRKLVKCKYTCKLANK